MTITIPAGIIFSLKVMYFGLRILVGLFAIFGALVLFAMFNK